MNHDHFLMLACKKISGEASEADLQELEAMLNADHELAVRFKLLKQYWLHHDDASHEMVEDSLQKVLRRLDLPLNNEKAVTKKRSILFSLQFRLAAAASVAAIIFLAVYFSSNKKTGQLPSLASLEKKQNTPGTKSTIQLADGSKVWLNAESKIQYPPVFEGKTREVYLNGEAFFEVAKNPQKPFIIHLANGTVRVLGTSFNIRAYDNEKIVETSVATGKVMFIPKYQNAEHKQDTVFLTPNNKVRYLFNAEKIDVLPTTAEDDKAWTEGRMIFKAMKLEDIAVELERNFGKKVVFKDDNVKGYVLTGSFQNNSLEDILFYLSKTKDFHYKINNNELLISTDTLSP